MLSPDCFCLIRPDQINAAFPSQHSSIPPPSTQWSPRSYSFLSDHRIMTLKYNILWTFCTQIHLKVPTPCITENSKEDDTQLTGKHERYASTWLGSNTICSLIILVWIKNITVIILLFTNNYVCCQFKLVHRQIFVISQTHKFTNFDHQSSYTLYRGSVSLMISFMSKNHQN